MIIRDKVKKVFDGKVGQVFSSEKIKQIVIDSYSDVGFGSVNPADYCYNRINKDKSSFILHMFELTDYSTYKCLGHNANYSGPIFWKPKGEDGLKHVGEWTNGKFKLWKDPRK